MTFPLTTVVVLHRAADETCWSGPVIMAGGRLEQNEVKSEGDYMDSFSTTFRICTPWTREAPPRMAQAT